MLYAISKLLLYLLNPTIWIVAGFLTAALSANKLIRKRALIISITALILLSNPFLINRFAQYWDIRGTRMNSTEKYSCAIVLGGFASDDGNGGGYFNTAADRFIQALRLQKGRQVDYLLLSGGNSQIIPGKFKESVWVRLQLLALGVADNRIIVESNSRNTYENARFAKLKLEAKKLPPPYLLITSAFHMRRALYTFNKAGIEVVPYSSNFVAGKQKITFEEFIPQAGVISLWGFYLKEIIGFGIYYVKG